MKKFLDWAFFVLPAAFLAVVLFDMSKGIGQGSKDLLNWKFISNVVFANSTHVGLTFGLLMTHAPVRTWAVQRYGSMSRFWWKYGIAFAVLSIVVFSVVQYGLRTPGFIGLKIYLFLHTLVAIQHALSQTTGIYGAAVFNHLDDKSGFPQFSAALRWFALIGTLCVVVITHIDAFWEIGEKTLKFQLLVSIPFFLSFIYLLWRRSKVQYRVGVKEGIFSTRLFLWLLHPFSFFAPVSVSAIHGLEYIKVTSHLTSYKIKLLMMIPFLVFIAIGLSNPHSGIPAWFYDFKPGQVPLIFPIVGALGLAGTYLHYYLDRQIFKMRDPVIRETVMPLLKDLARLNRPVRNP